MPRFKSDIEVFKAGLKGAPVADAFLPVVAPASAVPRHKNEYYKDDEEFLFALAEALREEYKAIIDAGLDRADRRRVSALHVRRGVAADDARRNIGKWAAVRIEALNHALEGIAGGPHPLSHLLGQLEHARMSPTCR